MMCSFQVNSKGNQVYIEIYLFFSEFYSHRGHHSVLRDFPVLCGGSLVVVTFMYNRAHTPIPTFQFFPSPCNVSSLVTISLMLKSLNRFLFCE